MFRKTWVVTHALHPIRRPRASFKCARRTIHSFSVCSPASCRKDKSHCQRTFPIPRGRKSRPGLCATIDVLSLGAAGCGGAEKLVRLRPMGQYLFCIFSNFFRESSQQQGPADSSLLAELGWGDEFRVDIDLGEVVIRNFSEDRGDLVVQALCLGHAASNDDALR